MVSKFFDAVAGIIIVAGIFVMVRPGSKGPMFVHSMSSGFANVIHAATGGGSFNG